MTHRISEQAAGLIRRRFLQLGIGGGLNLGSLLWARAARGAVGGSKIRACIVVFYYGGPSHIDTFDMKPDAPAEIRGDFKPIATSVPGLNISEHLPHMATRMHKVALIRSMHHRNRLHDSASIETHTGRPSPTGDREEFSPTKQFFPSIGSSVSYARNDRSAIVPHASLPFVFHNVVDVPCQGGGFLGTAFDPFRITVDPTARTYQGGALGTPEGQTRARIEGRRRLHESLEVEQLLSASNQTRQLRQFYDRAYELIDAEPLRRALDLTLETQATRDRYGFDPGPSGSATGGGAERDAARQMRGQNLLLARRLVEAGVPFVNVYDCRQQGQNWDAHAHGSSQHKDYLLPLADRALAALIDDLADRGLLDSTLIVALGEFGRTPRINSEAGRDHWPDCYTVLLAGGGVKGGYVHGSSDRLGAYPASDPVSPADLAATIFDRFGIDPAMEIHDLTNRPYRLADGEPIRGLFGS